MHLPPVRAIVSAPLSRRQKRHTQLQVVLHGVLILQAFAQQFESGLPVTASEIVQAFKRVASGSPAPGHLFCRQLPGASD